MAQKRKKSHGSVDLTPKQRQAALVLAICALVLIVTISAVAVLVNKSHHREDSSLSNVDSSDSLDTSAVTTLDLSKYGDAVLAKTDDAGQKYIDETLFVGDTNTYYYYKNALLDLDHVLGVENLKIQDFTTDKSIYFKKDNNAYSIPEAIAMMKPRRVIMMMGTANLDGSMEASEFIEKYKAAVDAIKAAYPHTDLIVAAVPPISKDHSRAPEASMETVNAFNEALAQMCVDNDLKFLNITEDLLGSDGYGKASYFRPGDLYMKKDGLLSIMDYARCHALDTEDRRPDTNNIPTRRTGTAGNDTDMTDKEDKEDSDKTFTAQYNVDKKVGGTLESGDQKGVTSLSFKDLNKDSKITVKAVPAKGYKFLKWSDGVTDATRTDKSFKQNINVTAMFTADLTIKIKEGSSATVEDGNPFHLHAVLSDPNVKLSKGDVVWYLDGKEVQKGMAYSPALPKADKPYVIKVVANTANGKIESGEFKLTVKAGEAVFTAKYVVENGGGTLESGSQKGASLGFSDLKANSSVTVKAVPDEGYKFVKWSDGNTNATRTDKDFTKDLAVTAIFEKDAPAPTQEPKVEVSIKEGSSGSITAGDTIHLHANITSGTVAADKVVWTLDGAEVQRGMAYSFTPDSAGTYTIKVTATDANGKSASASYTLTVNPKATPVPTPAPTPESVPEPTTVPPEPVPPEGGEVVPEGEGA